ncbi:MAG TPA: ABC transporter substrate-binding protein [Desulfovibrio sp.]|nr:ABC transporter substrate-binding protein [Desulfovibrio sp.]
MGSGKRQPAAGLFRAAASVRLAAALCLCLLTLLPNALAAAGEPQAPLVFGMSAPFTGPNRGLGIEYYRGITAYLSHVNEQGGVNGRRIEILPLDDGYNPEPAVRNTIRLVREDKVFALFSYVGTPTVSRVLPLLERFQDEHVTLLFPLTGARLHREPPYGRYVYNLRASYFEETRALVEHFVAAGRTRLAVLFQEDAYGRSGWDGVRRALTTYNLELAGEAAYARSAGFDADFGPQVRVLAASKPEAIITIGTYAACAAFIRDARDAGLTAPIACVSFSDADNMVKLLLQARRPGGQDYTVRLVCSQVVPSYQDVALPAVALYRRLMDRYAQMPPEGLAEPYAPNRYSSVSLEGFLNAVVLAEVVRRMPAANPRRQDIPAAVESLKDFDLGIGVPLNFSSGQHQALNSIYFTTVRGGVLVPLTDWTEWSGS